MRRLLRWFRRVWLAHDLWHWDQMLADEQQRHDQFEARMKSWRYQRALVNAELQRLRGRTKIDYLYGPTMKGSK